MRERSDNYIFQDQTVQDIATGLLADYPQVRVEFDIDQQLAPRPICTSTAKPISIFCSASWRPRA